MLEQKFEIVYTKFKLHFYQEIFERFQNREASLTTVETFAMETIQALGCPTINEFASFMRISPPNAAYKINSLIRKGYVQKIQSAHDKREYHLQVTRLRPCRDRAHPAAFPPGGVRQAGRDAHHYQPGTDARGGSRSFSNSVNRRGAAL